MAQPSYQAAAEKYTRAYANAFNRYCVEHFQEATAIAHQSMAMGGGTPEAEAFIDKAFRWAAQEPEVQRAAREADAAAAQENP